MSDPYAPPGSQRGTGQDQHRRRLPPSVPHRPTERRPPDPDGQLRAARLGLRFSLSVLAGLVAMSLPVPWNAGGPVFVVAGMVFGVMALVAAARARLRWPSFVTLGLGMGLAVLLLLVQAVTLVFWQATSERQRCVDSAVTQTALQQCQADYQQGVQSFLPSLPAPAPST